MSAQSPPVCVCSARRCCSLPALLCCSWEDPLAVIHPGRCTKPPWQRLEAQWRFISCSVNTDLSLPAVTLQRIAGTAFCTGMADRVFQGKRRSSVTHWLGLYGVERSLSCTGSMELCLKLSVRRRKEPGAAA